MRRTVFDPLEPTKEPRWYVVRNMQWAVLETRELPVGADLKRALAAAMLEYINAGWRQLFRPDGVRPTRKCEATHRFSTLSGGQCSQRVRLTFWHYHATGAQSGNRRAPYLLPSHIHVAIESPRAGAE
jgi:hypothetical protein